MTTKDNKIYSFRSPRTPATGAGTITPLFPNGSKMAEAVSATVVPAPVYMSGAEQERPASPPIQEEHPLMTVMEVMRMLRIGRNSAYNLVNSGQLPSIRIGRTIRVPRAAVIAFIESACGNTGIKVPMEENRKKTSGFC